MLATNTIIWIVLINAVLSFIVFLIFKKNWFLIPIYLIWISFFYYKLTNEKTLLYFLIPNIIIGFIFHLLIKNKPRAKEGIFNLEVETDKGNRVLENFIRGVSIFGSS